MSNLLLVRPDACSDYQHDIHRGEYTDLKDLLSFDLPKGLKWKIFDYSKRESEEA